MAIDKFLSIHIMSIMCYYTRLTNGIIPFIEGKSNKIECDINDSTFYIDNGLNRKIYESFYYFSLLNCVIFNPVHCYWQYPMHFCGEWLKA